MIYKRQSKIKIRFYLLKTLCVRWGLCTLNSLRSMKSYHHIFLIASLFVVQSCTTIRVIPAEVQYRNYTVSNQKQDTAFLMLISSYKDSVNKTMQQVIGFSTEVISKSNSNPSLGNFFTDAMKQVGEKYFQRKIDAAIMNYGGIRSYIPKGEITLGKVYELMPFDNLLVLQEIKGSVLKVFLDHIANSGGWPMSGISLQLKSRKAENIMIGGEPLDINKVYIVSQSGYVANGGENSDMLKGLPQIKIGLLIRNALIEYIGAFTANGKPVTSSPEKKMIHSDYKKKV